MKEKILIIRFSSFGDIFHAMACLTPLKRSFPDSIIHWATRSDFKSMVELATEVDKVWSFERKNGFSGLIRFAFELRKQGYTKVFDAHSNLRSHIVSFIIRPFGIGPSLIRRSKERLKRILLFNFRINYFPKPYQAMMSFLKPLYPWVGQKEIGANIEFSDETKEKVKAFLPKDDFITLVPSAAWEMKRWPLEHWKELILKLPENKFVVLGGPADSFCDDLHAIAPDRVTNLAGKLSLIESCYVTKKTKLSITADTGLLHVADLMGTPCLALIGPTAFGFPSGKTTQVLEVDLPCRPCTKDGRGKCSQDIYRRCMVEITPKTVANAVLEKLH